MTKVVQYGCGKMSVYTMRYVIEKGGKIVGAFDIDKSKHGHDISTLMGGEKYGVTIQGVEEFPFKEKARHCYCYHNEFN